VPPSLYGLHAAFFAGLQEISRRLLRAENQPGFKVEKVKTIKGIDGIAIAFINCRIF
jgi:hypothetical protein